MSEADQVVLLERREQVLLVTLNRPEARNAIDVAMAEALAAALETLDAEPTLSVGVLTGSPPGFCSGMDLKAFAGGERPWVEGRGFAGIAERGSRKPLIAAVEGFALAGGFEVALACDLIVAARDARFAIPEVKRGLFAAGGALIRLPRALPYHVVAELALTGEPQPAGRLHELGLLNRLCDPGQALAQALELAATITANSPLALRATKRILERQHDLTSEAAWSEQQALFEEVLGGPDASEGAEAFLQRRAPRWHSR